MDVAVVVVGDEILAGYVHDANTHFIAGRLSEHGHHLRRAAIVGDDPAEIAEEILRGRRAGASLVCVCGGLGSTHDDRTMEGVARALQRALEPCAPLAEVIERVIDEAHAQGFDDPFGADALRKMVLAPHGAELLRCSVGLIPAVAVEDDAFTVLVLPGPPDQLALVFREAVEPRYLAGTGREVHRVEITHTFPESSLAAKLSAIQASHPTTSVGSYPQRDHTLIRISGSEADVLAAADELRAHLDALQTSEEGKRFLGYLRDRRRR